MKTILMMICAFSASPAFAQRMSELPRRAKPADIPSGKAISVVDRGRIAMAEFASCVVDSRRTKLDKLLRMPFGSGYSRLLNEIATDNCLVSGKMNFQPFLFRGALFAELLRRRQVAYLTGKDWGPMLDPLDLEAESKSATDANTITQLALLAFAQCVVKRDRLVASDVVLRRIASSEQAEAYSRLVPHLAPCIVNGQKVAFSKPALEGVLAEVLYRSPPKSVQSGAQ